MSTISKKGPCRIPTFGSRIPQIHSKPQIPEITSKQVGKKVRVGEKEGVLRFVGSVHFSKEVWCGIELFSRVGKNDGFVKGIRYFLCPDHHGLMVPLSKVSLVEGSCESLNDDVSGPYSMLFIEPKHTDNTYINTNKSECVPTHNKDALTLDKIVCLSSQEENSDPVSNKRLNQPFAANQKYCLDSNRIYEILESSNSSEDINTTCIKKQENETYHTSHRRSYNLNFTKNLNETINNCTFENGAKPKLTEKLANEESAGGGRNYEGKTLSDTINSAVSNSNFDLEKHKKRTNKTFEVSSDDVNITRNIPDNTLSPITTNATFETDAVIVKDSTFTHLPINKSCENLLNDSSVEVKRRRTSNPKNQKIDALILKSLPDTIDKPSSLPQLRSALNLNSPSLTSLALNKFSQSTPARGEFTEALLRNWRMSGIGGCDKNINYDEDNSKRDSLEFEESLGILTPDQMTDGMTFANMQTRSPSLEYESNISEFVSKVQESGRKSELPSPRDVSLGILDEKVINIAINSNKEFTNRDIRDSDLHSPNLNNITDYSLGIIDEQMVSNLAFSPRDGYFDDKVNNIAVNSNKELTLDVPGSRDVKNSDLQSPNLNSITDYSLGIIDEQMISNLTLRTDTTMNMELPLDSIGKSKDFTLTRLEQTPSPEELPLDPTPVIESDPKTEPSKSKTTSSFITSITSITSLDTGYQGDGEMSRPASRGGDNSPLTRRPLPRPQPRRPDPMTDSDFYTESDADNHEDNQLRGDRKAQVIDGTLYGVDPQAAADIYVNNRENMDSSGIFTDLENNTRNDDDTPNEVPDASPSDTSSKTISENSQNNLQEVLDKSNKTDRKDVEKTPLKDNPKKRNAPSPGISSPSSMSSPRHGVKEENAAKKYKMPKRDVASKVKAMLEPNQMQQNEKKTLKKPVGRWDAVLNKMTKNEQNKTNLKEVKSKVFNNVNLNIISVQKQNDNRIQNTRTLGNQKNINNKNHNVAGTVNNEKKRSPRNTDYISQPNLISNKKSPVVTNKTSPSKRSEIILTTPVNPVRRIRNRTSTSSTPKNVGSNVESSIHSSLSDLSSATIPPKKIIGSVKKQRDIVQVTQVLTASKLSPRTQQQQTAAENKKNAILHPSSSNDSKTRRTIFSPKEKKQTIIKECARGTVKGGRTSPSVRPPTQTRVPAKQQVPRVAEALAVLVQHLVFNVEAYQVPTLRRQVEKFRLEAEEIRLACQQLEETLAEERIKQTRAIDEERKRCRNDITELIEKHRNQVAQLNDRHAELEKCLRSEKESTHQNLCKQHEEQLVTLKKEFERLQRTHEESLDILREENESIREQIDEKQLEVVKANHESMKLKKDYESKEIVLKEHNQKLRQEVKKLESAFEDRLKGLVEENKRLREENDRLLSYGDDKGIGIQEVQSLRAVLEIKQKEVGELRKALAEATQRADILVGAEEKARVLNARCEDLQLQLQRKSEYEQNLLQENVKLQESFKEETNQKRRLYQYNEELQWKLKQNKEVISKVLEQAEETAFNRSLLSSSFNERHSSSRLNLERALSFRERTYSNKSNVSTEDSVRSRKSKNSLEYEMEDLSPPSSPKVKGVVEKSDSVSYVLDLDESPDVVASRIVRRSFRNSTPPKNTPTKSPSNKRPRIRNPLSQSASSSAIITTNKNEIDRPRSASVRNGECDNDNVFLWTSNVSSTPKAYGQKLDENYDSSHSSMKLDDNLDLDEDHEVDIQLPALPSELDRRNGAQALPSPKHLAGEAMISESNSEDESTSSSQL